LLLFVHGTFAGSVIYRLLQFPPFSKIYSVYLHSSLSRWKIDRFVKKHGVDLEQFVVPDGGYKTFADFFTRKLLPGAREIDKSDTVLVSPADGKLFVIDNFRESSSFFVKIKNFTLHEFVGTDENSVSEFDGAQILIFRLCPYDYHRFHMPVSGKIRLVREVGGSYKTVNMLTYFFGENPLIKNYRQVFKIKNNLFGEFFFVVVAAMIVGKIHTIIADRRERYINKGDELGYFGYGASTIVVVLKKGTVKFAKDYLKHSLSGYETSVLFGDPVAILRRGNQ